MTLQLLSHGPLTWSSSHRISKMPPRVINIKLNTPTHKLNFISKKKKEAISNTF